MSVQFFLHSMRMNGKNFMKSDEILYVYEAKIYLSPSNESMAIVV